MKRATGILPASVVLAMVGTLALAAPAGATGAHAQAATHVNFTKWIVYVVSGRTDVGHTVPVGGTFQRCASKTMDRLRAFYTTTGPSRGPDRELWDLNGHTRDSFSDPRLGPSGYFGIFNTNKGGLPAGYWSLTIKYGGKQVGHATVRVTVKRGC